MLVTRPTHALVFVSDPDLRPSSIEPALRQLYGFTYSEARFAAYLLGGGRVEEIAALLGVSLNTARTHTRRILEKSGARGQADLLRMLASGAGSVRSDGSTPITARRAAQDDDR